MAQELAKLGRVLGNMPAGVRRGWLSKARKTAAPHPGGWLRFHLAIQIPTLPDSLIKHEIIAPLELTVTAAAQALGITRAARSTLLNERASLSVETALRADKAFGVSMNTLMLRQRPSASRGCTWPVSMR